MYFGHIVVDTFYQQPVAIRCHHFPAQQIINTGSPDYRMFSAGIGSDIAADGAGPQTGRVSCEYMRLRCFHHLAGHSACSCCDCGHFSLAAHISDLNRTNGIELFNIDHHSIVGQWYRTATQARPPPSGNNHQPQTCNSANQPRKFIGRIRRKYTERCVVPPVCGISGMMSQRIGIEMDIIRMGISGKSLARFPSLGRLLLEPCIKFFQQMAGTGCHLLRSGVVAGSGFNTG